jgi:predicted TIM-barrel fold metal-dependent hydrolase
MLSILLCLVVFTMQAVNGLAMVPLIGLEEHFFSDDIADPNSFAGLFKYMPGAVEKMRETGQTRIQSMDRGGVNVQVLSHGAGLGDSTVADCVAANNDMARRVATNPRRYKAFAVLPMCPTCVEAAAKELVRCVKELGFMGALIDNHYKGAHFEGAAYRPLWKAAQDLDVPIYLHPTFPSPDMLAHYQGNVSVAAAASLSTVSWGWHSDTGMHVLKLYSAGVFDDFPKLKLVIGHFGEMLPFMLERVANFSPRWGNRTRSFMDMYHENIWLTTSAVWSINPMATLLRNTKIERILFSVDYPFISNEVGLKFMEDLRSSGLVTEAQLKMIGYENAEKLLKIKLVV